MKFRLRLFLTSHADCSILEHDHLPGHGKPNPHTVAGLISCLIKPVKYIWKVFLRDSFSVISDKISVERLFWLTKTHTFPPGCVCPIQFFTILEIASAVQRASQTSWMSPSTGTDSSTLYPFSYFHACSGHS